MKIGIIGTGNMGRSLGLLWSELGHEVFFGSRTREKAEKAVQLSGGKAFAGSNSDAAAFGDVLVYTARGVDPLTVVEDITLLDGKIVIDCNNSDVTKDFVFPPIQISLAELLQQQIPHARVVKSFNTMGMEVFELCPNEIKPYKVSNFVCGDDTKARQIVSELSDSIGFDTIDCGELVRARFLEAQADFIRLLLISGIRADAAFSIINIPDVKLSRLGGREYTSLGELK